MISHLSQNHKPNPNLISEIKTLIEQSKQQVAVAVNAALSMLYWNIGYRINKEVLLEARAKYGKVAAYSLAMKIIIFQDKL